MTDLHREMVITVTVAIVEAPVAGALPALGTPGLWGWHSNGRPYSMQTLCSTCVNDAGYVAGFLDRVERTEQWDGIREPVPLNVSDTERGWWVCCRCGLRGWPS